MSFLSSAKNALKSIISLTSDKMDYDDDSPVEAYIYRVDVCDSAGDFLHHSFHTENEIYSPQQSPVLTYSRTGQRLHIRKCEKPRNERCTNTFTMTKEKTEMINYSTTRNQVNAVVALNGKQEEVKALLDCYVCEYQNEIIEDLKQQKLGRASE